MSVATLNAEQKEIYDHIVDLEKQGGSDAYLAAIASAPMLLRHTSVMDEQPFGFDFSVPLSSLRVSSSWGSLSFSVTTKDGHIGNGSGLGYISTDINVSNSGDLYYLTWGLMLGADSFTTAGVDGYLFIYFSNNSIPAGFLKAKANFGAIAGTGSCTWRQG